MSMHITATDFGYTQPEMDAYGRGDYERAERGFAVAAQRDLWQKRANALGDVFAAASHITNVPFQVRDMSGRILVDAEDVTRLENAVEKYMAEAHLNG